MTTRVRLSPASLSVQGCRRPVGNIGSHLWPSGAPRRGLPQPMRALYSTHALQVSTIPESVADGLVVFTNWGLDRSRWGALGL